MDDAAFGRTVRVLRQRRRLRQLDLAGACDLAQTTVSRVERGHVETLSLRALRQVAAAVDARLTVSLAWRGADLDRLLDERHAELSGAAAGLLTKLRWLVIPEASYSRYGERGSIDLLAMRADHQTVLVVEIKTELVSLEETLRRLDTKARLARVLGVERFGVRAQHVGRLLVLPDASTPRRHVLRHDAVLGKALPHRGPSVRGWLDVPIGPLAGVLFLSLSHGRAGRRRSITPTRVRRPSPVAATHEP